MRLANKTALITGGNGGIGLATAKLFVAEGAKVVITGRNQATLEAAAKELGPNALAVVADATDIAATEAAFAKGAAKFGKYDILFANAGIAGGTPLGGTTVEAFEKVISTNLTGVFFTVQSALPHLKDNASIILNGSVISVLGIPGYSAYGSAKAGLELLTKVMAVELAEFGINVNNIAPGAIETEMAKFAHDQATRAAYNYLIPMTRYGTPEEIADAAVFLSSDESRYIHGHTLNVDGGFRAAGLMFRGDKAAPGG